MERKIKLVPYRVHKYCPKCTGTMEAMKFGVITTNGTGNYNISLGVGSTISAFTMTSETFNHMCNKCGHGENYDKTYPYIDYIEDGDVG